MAPALSLPAVSRTRVLQGVAAVILLRACWRAGRWVWRVLTSVDETVVVRHNCVPPEDWKPAAAQTATLELVRRHHPELVDLVESGKLIAVQPAALLSDALDAARASGSPPPALTEEQVSDVLGSPALQACLSDRPPPLLFMLGTVHVSKQSATEVERVMRAVRPTLVLLELCPARLQAILIDPYKDPLHDLEPCSDKLEAAASLRHRGVLQVVRAALERGDYSTLTTLLTGMYTQVEDKLGVRTGIEFIAARRTLIQMLAEEGQKGAQQQENQQQQESSEQQELQQQQQEQQQQQQSAESHTHEVTWLQHCIAADRPVQDTLLGVWAALRPWRRLQFMGDLLTGLIYGIDEEAIASLAQEDMVELLLKEFQESYPEVMRPLLHDRNYILALATWRAGAMAAAHGPVLAIVGKGHLSGMVYSLEQLADMQARAVAAPLLAAQRSHQ